MPLLIAVLLGTMTLARAMPPVRTRIPGWYDDADYDDIAILARSPTRLTDAGPSPSPARFDCRAPPSA